MSAWLGVAVALILGVAGCGVSTAARQASLQAAGSATRLTYVAVGASDAFGVGTDDPASESWPTQLADELGPGVHLVNLGIPGEQVSDALANELPVAVDEQPDVVTVWLGVNDFVANVAPDDYARQLESLVSALRQRTHARIAVGNLPDLTLLPAFADRDPSVLRSEVQRWNADIAAICARQDVTLVDLYGGWAELASHPEYISSDGFHPSALGARRLADLFAASMRR